MASTGEHGGHGPGARDRRRHHRVIVLRDWELIAIQGGRTWRGDLLNVSRSGLAARIPDGGPGAGSWVRIEVYLAGERVLTTRADVIACNPLKQTGGGNRLRLRFEDPEAGREVLRRAADTPHERGFRHRAA